MFKPVYRFIGKPAALSAFCLALVMSGCQDNMDEKNQLEVEDLIAFSNGDLIPGQYIVVLNESGISFRKDGSYEEVQAGMRKDASNLLAKYRISGENLREVYGSTLDGFAATLTQAEFDQIKSDPNVKYVEQDRFVALAPPPGRGPGGGGGATGQTVPYGITRVGGHANYTGNNVAYVLDTGIELDHEDLNVDASKGFNAFTSGRDGNSLTDGNGHGTHVAGTIAAIDNNIGVVGVAAGAPVVPIKVLDSRGSGSYSGVIAGVNFVGANGKAGDVANMSLGGPVSQALDDAVLAASNKGIWFVLAAGNESRDANLSSPARVNGTYIYTISAMDSNDRFASFSNWGNPPVDWCAPGVGINSTWISNSYRSISGTSMAAPHVAGIRLLGNVRQDGNVQNDPDGTPDKIAVR
ncbi:S8 family peptidase [Litoribacter alkaliphilus]|uniref:S8 family peptidase n=1 Tax=Litoribacter ruber TaxID=702568 RepID=A0AAP2G5E3_9BACT|nr:S8 family peptidase [Litoribacter alkaliphilus]MBS9524438.1 S8 family peptidase [Litoribacter alkaliphilus]